MAGMWMRIAVAAAVLAAASAQTSSVYSSDFTNSPDGWKQGTNTNPATTFCGAAFGQVLGGHCKFGRNVEVTKTIPVAPQHNAILLELDYFFIRTWDFENAIVSVSNDAGQFVEVERFQFQAGSATGFACSGQRTGIERFRLVFRHSAPQITIRVTSDIDQTACDESWAIGNIDLFALNLQGTGSVDFAMFTPPGNAQDWSGNNLQIQPCQPVSGAAVYVRSGAAAIGEAFSSITLTKTPAQNALRIRFKYIYSHTVGNMQGLVTLKDTYGSQALLDVKRSGTVRTAGDCAGSTTTEDVDVYVISKGDPTFEFKGIMEFEGQNEPAFAVANLMVDALTLGSAPYVKGSTVDFATGPNGFASVSTLQTTRCQTGDVFMGPTAGAIEDYHERAFTGLPAHTGLRITMKLVLYPGYRADERQGEVLLDGAVVWSRRFLDVANNPTTTCGIEANLPLVQVVAISLTHTASTATILVRGSGNQFSRIRYAFASVQVEPLALTVTSAAADPYNAAGNGLDALSPATFGGFGGRAVTGCPQTPAIGAVAPIGYALLEKSYSQIPSHQALKISLTFSFTHTGGEQFGSVSVDGRQVWGRTEAIADGASGSLCGATAHQVSYTFKHTASTLKVAFEGAAITSSGASFALYGLRVETVVLGEGAWQDKASDFTGGPDNWLVPSLPGTSDCAGFGYILGGHGDFGRGVQAIKKYTGLPGHNAIRIELRYWFFRTWDREYAEVYVDNVRKWRFQFIGVGHKYTCEGAAASFEDVSILIPSHLAGSITVRVQSTIDQTANDEAWGVSDIRIIPFTKVGSGTEPLVPGPQVFTTIQQTNWVGSDRAIASCGGATALQSTALLAGGEAFLTNQFTGLASHNAVRIQFDVYHLHAAMEQTLTFHVGATPALTSTEAAGAGACGARNSVSFDSTVLHSAAELQLDFKAVAAAAAVKASFAIANLRIAPTTLGVGAFSTTADSFAAGPSNWIGEVTATSQCAVFGAVLGPTTGAVQGYFQKKYTGLPAHDTVVFKVTFLLRRRDVANRAKVFTVAADGTKTQVWAGSYGSFTGNPLVDCDGVAMLVADAYVAIPHTAADIELFLQAEGNQYSHMAMAIFEPRVLPISGATNPGTSTAPYQQPLDDRQNWFGFAAGNLVANQACGADGPALAVQSSVGVTFMEKTITGLDAAVGAMQVPHNGLRITFKYLFTHQTGTQFGLVSYDGTSVFSQRATAPAGRAGVVCDGASPSFAVTKYVFHQGDAVTIRAEGASGSGSTSPAFALSGLEVEPVVFGTAQWTSALSDFSTGPDLWAIPATLPGTTQCAGKDILGGHGVFGANAAAVKTYTGLPSHNAVRVELRYWIIRTWDFEMGQVFVDNALVWAEELKHSNPTTDCSGQTTSFRDLALIIAGHTNPTITVKVTSTLQQNAFDESFGISDVRIVPISLDGLGEGVWASPGTEVFATTENTWVGADVQAAPCGAFGSSLLAAPVNGLPDTFAKKTFLGLPAHNALRVVADLVPNAQFAQDFEVTLDSVRVAAPANVPGGLCASASGVPLDLFVIHSRAEATLDVRVTPTQQGNTGESFAIGSGFKLEPVVLGRGDWTAGPTNFAMGPQGFLGATLPFEACTGGSGATMLGRSTGSVNGFFRKVFSLLPQHVGLVISLKVFLFDAATSTRSVRVRVDNVVQYTVARNTAAGLATAGTAGYTNIDCGGTAATEVAVSITLSDHAATNVDLLIEGTGSVHSHLRFGIADVALNPQLPCSPGEGVVIEPNATANRRCASCGAGEFTPDRPHTFACRPVRTCANDQYESAAPSQTSDRGCTALTVCDAAKQYAAVAATKSSDRQCAPLTECDPAFLYETTAPTRTTDRACAALTACRNGVSFEQTAPTPTSDRTCAPCTTCPAGRTTTSACSTTADTVCSGCTPCVDGEFISQQCSANKDTVCATCTVCDPGEFGSGVCDKSAGTDFTCVACQTACPAGQYISQACGAQSDIVCSPITTCDLSQFEFLKPTANRDRECRAVTNCRAGEFEATPPTPMANPAEGFLTDRICLSCPSGSYTSQSQQTMCTPCLTSCQRGQFLLGTCSATGGPACVGCPNCPAGSYQTGGCDGGDKPRTCAQCDSTCAAGSYLDGACQTPTQFDRSVCLTCDPSCSTCDAPVAGAAPRFACVTCAADRVRRLLTDPADPDAGKTVCATGCGNDEFEDILGNVCVKCDASCKSCSGAGPKKCVACNSGPGAAREFLTVTAAADGTGTCGACSTPNSGFFQDASSGLCKPCQSCQPGFRQTRACTTTADAVCERCTFGAEFQDLVGQTQCKPLTLCQAGEEETTGPSNTADRVCTPCGASRFQPSQGGKRCQAWTTCNLDRTFETQAGTRSTDRVCTAVTECFLMDQFISTRATLTTDNVCRGFRDCAAGNRVASDPTPTRNRVCTACGLGTFQDETNQIVCKPLRRCTGETYQDGPAVVGQAVNRECLAKDQCNFPQEYTVSRVNSNNDCIAFTVCPEGWTELQGISRTADRICEGKVQFTFSGDFATAAGTAERQAAFKAEMVNAIRQLDGRPVVAPEDISLVSGSIVAVVATSNPSTYNTLKALAEDSTPLQVAVGGRSYSGFAQPLSEPASSTSSSSGGGGAVIIGVVVAAVVVIAVVVLAAYLYAKRDKDPVVQTGIDYDAVAQHKERAATAKINPVYATSDPTGVVSMSGMAAALGEGGFENPLYEDEGGKQMGEGSYADVNPGAMPSSDGYLDVAAAAQDDPGYMSVRARQDDAGYMDVSGEGFGGGFEEDA